MCKIFGVTSKNKHRINEYLKRFYQDSDKHPHGWGLALIEDGNVNIEKEPLQATKSYYLKERLTQDIWVTNAFAHIRLATIGNVEFANCHPYLKKDHSGRVWTFVHNGTIFDYDNLKSYLARQEGDTDSERILLYLIHCVDKEKNKNVIHKRFGVIDDIIADMSVGNKLNLLFSDGEYTYAHTNYPDSLYYLDKGDTTLFSTSPLSREEWEPLPMTSLIVYKDGKKVYQGKSHGNVYVEKEEDLRYLYRICAGL